MAVYIQPSLLSETEEEKINRRFEKVETEVGNVRRGIFQRHNDLLGMILDLQEQVKTLKQDKTHEDRAG